MGAAALGLLLTLPVGAFGQNVDSLVGVLGSPSVSARAQAVARLNLVPIQSLSSAARQALVQLLEREATGQVRYDQTTGKDDETYSEYVIDLTRGVLRLQDASAVRGIAFLGIETSRAAQEFIATRGSAAIPVLNEVWISKERARPAIITTWGYTLASTTNGLAPEDRAALLGRIMQAVPAYPIPTARAARTASLITLLIPLRQIADTATDPAVKNRLAAAASELEPRMAAASATDVLAQLAEVIAGICQGASGARQGTCSSIQSLVTDARQHIAAGRTNAAHSVLGALRQRAQTGLSDGTLTALEATIIAENARVADSKL